MILGIIALKLHLLSLALATVGTNKKFLFRLCSTVVLRRDRSSKNGMEFLLWKRSTHRLYGFQMVKVLECL